MFMSFVDVWIAIESFKVARVTNGPILVDFGITGLRHTELGTSQGRQTCGTVLRSKDRDLISGMAGDGDCVSVNCRYCKSASECTYVGGLQGASRKTIRRVGDGARSISQCPEILILIREEFQY